MQPRDVVNGRFEIDRLAGHGGMGTVFRATDRQTGAAVAVKVILGRGPELAERFAREAAVLSELEHRGIVRFVASGTTPQGEAYLVMEWLTGEGLADRIARGPLSVAETIELGRHVAAALAVAHARGVVHRDLKPSNLFLEGGEVAGVKLLDFGIARIVQEGQSLTRTGQTLGSPGYTSPEQARGDRGLDARADVFSLACVLFACLTGEPPFTGGPLQVLMKVVTEQAPLASSRRPDVPPALDALLQRMLAKKPEDRPADAAAVGMELAALAGTTPGAASSSPTQAADSVELPPTERGVDVRHALATVEPPRPAAAPPPDAAPAPFRPASHPPSTFRPPSNPPPPGQPTPFRTAPGSYPPPAAATSPFGSGPGPARWSAPPPAFVPPADAPPAPAPTALAPAPPAQSSAAAVVVAVVALLVVAGAGATSFFLFMNRSGTSSRGGPQAPAGPGTVHVPAFSPCGGGGLRCAPFNPADPAHVDPMEVLPTAQALAQSVDKGASFCEMSLIGAVDGTLPLGGDQKGIPAVMQLRFAGGKGRSVDVAPMLGQLFATEGAACLHPSPPPPCTPRAAARAAVASGVPRGTAMVMMYHHDEPSGGPVWEIAVAGKPEHVRRIDGRSCAVKFKPPR